MLNTLSSLKHGCGWIRNIVRSISVSHDSVCSSEPGEVVMIVGVVAGYRHIPLTTVRVAGESSQIRSFSHIVWLKINSIDPGFAGNEYVFPHLPVKLINLN